MASACLTLLIGALVLLTVYLIKKYTYWKRRGIPTASGVLPLLGNMLPVLTLRYSHLSYNVKVYDDHKEHSMVGYYKFLKPVLLVREPQLIKTVMQTNFSSFADTGMILRPDLDPLLSKNPFFNVGEAWSRARKRMTNAFSNAKLKILHGAVNGVCKKFEDFLNRQLSTSDKYEVELKQLFLKFTGEVVANAGLGIEGYCFDDNKKSMAFYAMLEPLFKTNLFMGILQIIFFVPELRNFLRLRFIPKELDQTFRGIVKENLQIRRNDPKERSDYLQVMIDMEKTDKQNIDEEAITAEALSLYVDGLETSSITLSYLGFHLATHPDIQEKLRQEVKSKIAKYDGVLTFEALKEMTYMDQVISESQRCCPVVSALKRQCTETIELKGSDGLSCRVQPGTIVMIPNFSLQRDPKYWPDPELFDPERFNEERKQDIVKMTHLPFGEGPRMCVGMKMAMLQMKSCVATLLSKYKLELSKKTQQPLKYVPHSFMLTPVGGIWVHISKI
nr:PREDICTED: cytochrome P450 9e2 [Megachile rotundata]